MGALINIATKVVVYGTIITVAAAIAFPDKVGRPVAKVIGKGITKVAVNTERFIGHIEREVYQQSY